MIDSQPEYQRMFEVEQKLWWYQILHQKVLKGIRDHCQKPAEKLSVLDAACGTGGLLFFLRQHGFQQLSGFDYSPHAVLFSGKRGLDVEQGDLRHVENFRPGVHYDVITCNDALYFLTDEEIVRAMSTFRRRLKPGGILLINIHAFEAFSGTHDVAVGSTRRFTRSDFRRYAASAGLTITGSTYWPFLLSLPIYLVRNWQRYQIRRGVYSSAPPDSDVRYPGNLINGILKVIVRSEELLLPSAPFGSSLFMVMQPTARQ